MMFRVGQKDVAQRLDIFLRDHLGSSRREVLRLLGEGCVTVNGVRQTEKAKGLPLTLNSEIVVEDHEKLGRLAPNKQLDLSILTAGEGYIIVDKPAGMPVMPLHHSETSTVLNYAVAYYPELQGVGEGGLKSGVVHRLDTDTSGALLVATSEARWQQFRAAFREHRSEKIYHALVHGNLHGERREAQYLVVAKHKDALVAVVERQDLGVYPQARHCRLSWRALERLKQATLIEVTLETGFLHQIRAMFAHLGHKVIGDKRYGQNAADIPDLNAARHMLHAAHLTVENISADSPYPPDFAQVLESLRY